MKKNYANGIDALPPNGPPGRTILPPAEFEPTGAAPCIFKGTDIFSTGNTDPAALANLLPAPAIVTARGLEREASPAGALALALALVEWELTTPTLPDPPPGWTGDLRRAAPTLRRLLRLAATG